VYGPPHGVNGRGPFSRPGNTAVTSPLGAAARYGFCLAGGYAVQAHGFVDRVSEDVDLFTTMTTVAEFPRAQADVVAALRTDGPTFARLGVSAAEIESAGRPGS
jgi:hypothetical protein